MKLTNIVSEITYGNSNFGTGRSDFSEPRDVWIIDHYLNSVFDVQIQCFDPDNNQLHDFEINTIDVDSLQILFKQPMVGYCIYFNLGPSPKVKTISNCDIVEYFNQLCDNLEICDVQKLLSQFNDLKSKLELKILSES